MAVSTFDCASDTDEVRLETKSSVASSKSAWATNGSFCRHGDPIGHAAIVARWVAEDDM
jgi:hypothetical protein